MREGAGQGWPAAQAKVELGSIPSSTASGLGQGWPMSGPVNTGAPETIRTSDHRLRRAVLYPAELRARGAQYNGDYSNPSVAIGSPSIVSESPSSRKSPSGLWITSPNATSGHNMLLRMSSPKSASGAGNPYADA